MSLLPCLRCGRTDARRMIGLMTLWFSRFLEEPADGGYFYLCPACYDEVVAPHLGDVRRRVSAVLPMSHARPARPAGLDEGPPLTA